MSRRRISQPVFLLPKNEELGRCSFRKGCTRECVPPNFANFDDLMRKRLSNEISHWLKKIKDGKGDFWKERNRSADELTLLLQGSVIPGVRIGDGKYCACGDAVPVLGLRLMQNFSIEEIRDASEGMDFSIPLVGAYAASASPQPTGLNSHFAMLLARIAANELDERRHTLRILEVEGGLGGARAISLIAAEPTTPFYIRNAFLDSLANVAGCVDFGADAPQIIDREIAFSISRFSTMEIVICETECGVVPAALTGKNTPPMPSEPDMGRMRQMCLAYSGEIFQVMMNIAGRIDALIHSGQGGECAKNMLAGFYFNLRRTIWMIAGRGNRNLDLAIEMCERKERDLYGTASNPEERGRIALERMDTEDQAVAKAVVEKMLEEGVLDGECAERLIGLLANGRASRKKQILELHGIAAKAQSCSEAIFQ